MRLSLLFLLLIPALIALGHDFYLFYMQHLNPGTFSLDLLLENFKFSALGFIWTTYSVETYKAVVEATAPDMWVTIDKFLTIKAFFLGLGFTATMIGFFIILKQFGLGPMHDEENFTRLRIKRGKEPESFRSGAQKKQIKYTRK